MLVVVGVVVIVVVEVVDVNDDDDDDEGSGRTGGGDRFDPASGVGLLSTSSRTVPASTPCRFQTQWRGTGLDVPNPCCLVVVVVVVAVMMAGMLLTVQQGRMKQQRFEGNRHPVDVWKSQEQPEASDANYYACHAC